VKQKFKLLGKYPIFTVFLSLASAVIGGYWTFVAQGLYEHGMEIFNFSNGVTRPMWLGIVYGLIIGFSVGRLFVDMLEKLSIKHKMRNLITFGLLLGIASGVVCSCVVHILLMISYSHLVFGPMFFGLFFGAFSGVVLGVVASSIFATIHFRKNKNEK